MTEQDYVRTELLKRWNQEALDEILCYKWIESEKAGRDIGVITAAFDWMEKHYEDWCVSREYLKPFIKGFGTVGN